jgi:hypothetical protein
MILRFLAVLIAGGVLLSAILPIYASTDAAFSIDAHVISAGSSVRSASPCYRLTATIAEPVAGLSSNADLSLSGGFLTHNNVATSDAIFFSGFEDCTP